MADDQIYPVINVEEEIGRIVGRKNVSSPAAVCARIQETGREIYRTQGFRVCPKGVFKFRSFEEADEWMNREMIRRAMRKG